MGLDEEEGRVGSEGNFQFSVLSFPFLSFPFLSFPFLSFSSSTHLSFYPLFLYPISLSGGQQSARQGAHWQGAHYAALRLLLAHQDECLGAAICARVSNRCGGVLCHQRLREGV